MLTELCQELKNWFDRERHTGTFEIVDGNLTADFLAEGQYFRVMGSIFNDGVHQWPTDVLRDETFTGSIWAMAIPDPVLKLAEDIDEWREKYEAADSAAMSPFASESFGGYSYSKSGTGSSNSGGTTGGSWQTAFAPRLNAWRKI
jgi:hypothetical protein